MKFLIFPILLFALVNCRDYCKFCENHIACNNDNKIAAKCRDRAEVIDLDRRNLKGLILHLHNDIRNQVASGQFGNLDPAKKMASMEWDNELGYMAELNVKTCETQHDACRSTNRFFYSAQNLAWWEVYADLEPEELINTLFGFWSTNSNFCTPSMINGFDSIPETVRQFTIMITDRNDRVGCGLIRIAEDSSIKYILTCNYATSNILNVPVYEIGSTASECMTGRNRYYPGLCLGN